MPSSSDSRYSTLASDPWILYSISLTSCRRVYGNQDEERASVAETKKMIQDAFRATTSLLSDMPKVNHGNTNDGNTSKRFFDDIDTVSEITGIERELLANFKVILELLNSNREIDHVKSSDLCHRTDELYVNLYPWYPVSPTLHKILIYGPAIIRDANLSIGLHRNKHFGDYRMIFARRYSRTAFFTLIFYTVCPQLPTLSSPA